MIDFKKLPSPCYVMDEKLLKKNLELLKKVKDESGCSIILALKGFSMSSVFHLVREYLDGATASSLNEAKLCFEKMLKHSHTYCTVYLEDEFNEIQSYSSHLTFNSLNQWKKYRNRIDDNISVGIRVNPEYSEVKIDLYNPCKPGSRFGVRKKDFESGKLPEGIDGIHFHALCGNDSHTLERTWNSFENLFSDMLKEAKWLNMGGGHLITSKDYDVDHLINMIKGIRETYDIDVILEPGSGVAWETGYLVSTVEDIFDSDGVMVAILDISFTCHAPDVLEMPYKPTVIGAHHDPIEGKPTYRFGGISCLSGDYTGDYSFDEPLKVGDKIVFEDMMHYTTVKTTTFNGINLPTIAISKLDGSIEIVKQFGYESFLDRIG